MLGTLMLREKLTSGNMDGMSPVPSAFTLEWLLDPVKPIDFYEQYYESKPLLVSRGELEYYAKLPRLEAVDELLTATVSNRRQPTQGERLTRSEPDGTMSDQQIRTTGNAGLDVQAAYRAYHDGFTVVINQTHRRSAAVGRLCRGLQAALHHPIGANIYLTPAGAQGFLPHVDTHDVFILQLHGTKEWHVSSPPVELPLAHNRNHKQTLPDAQIFTLMPGDMLYLPRGFRHKAVTGDSSSLHLTVGIHAFRWHDLFKDALEQLADEDAIFRSALPPQYVDEPLDMAHVTEMVRRMTAALTDESFMEKAKERIASKLIAADESTGLSQFRSLDALADLSDESIVSRSPEHLCLVRIAPDRATIEFVGNFVTGPPVLGKALEFIAQRHRFAVGELPGNLSTEDRIDLVKRLVSEGLLEVLL
ncbi:cupin domain-containing protein [Kitasatospora griseola]|uniref:cupin domain-containing protein n=1 Tax=Kitasatospora griseola TaxID=2064 RepID=UPI001670E76B|nr:cupin domain-containing protein [Kitasatospora griseola]